MRQSMNRRRGVGVAKRGVAALCAAGLAAAALVAAPGTAAAASPSVDRRILSNGITLLVSEQHALPMVVLHMFVDAGARRDPQGKDGLAGLTGDLLTEGTKTRSASQIKEATDFIGAALETGADTDYAGLGLTVLRKDLDTGLDLLTDVLLHPTFPEGEVTRRREAALASMQAEQDDPGRVANRLFTETLFRNEPYGHPVVGSPRTVPTINRHDIVAFYQQYYHPEHAIISVAGDVTAAEMAARLEQELQSWSKGSVAPFEYPATAPRPPLVVKIDKPITQANIILGQRGVARDNPDYYALTVMNFILGSGGFTSRLVDNVRVKGGLAYSVGSVFSVNKAPGSFQVGMQTRNESANDAIQRTCAEIERIRREPVGDDELADAKLYLTGSFPLRLDANAKLASFLAQVEFFNLGADYTDTYAQRVNAVTKEDIQRVAQQYLQPDQLQLVVVANLEQAKVPAGAPCRPASPEP